MKTGKSLVELAQTLEDIKQNSKDFLVPASKLEMGRDLKLVFENGKKHEFAPNDYSHGQIAGYTGIPKNYYDLLKGENPQLLSMNVNHGFGKKSEETGRGGKPETRMIRTHRGGIRAVLSSSYRRLDSHDLCNHVLPVLADKRLEVVSSELTETRLYLKAMHPKLKSEIKPGDVVQYGLLISNSDVGAGSVKIEPITMRLVCKNGLIANTAIKKFHVGKNMAGDDIEELLSAETMNLTDKAFWAQVQDILIASLDPTRFEAEVNRHRLADQQKITNFDIPTVVELAMRSVNYTNERAKDNIIAYLANGADGAGLTKWGMAQGFGYAAQDAKVGFDQSIELERAGSKVLDLHAGQWKRIAEVA